MSLVTVNCYRNKCDSLVKSIVRCKLFNTFDVDLNFVLLLLLLLPPMMMKMNCSLNFDRSAQQTVLASSSASSCFCFLLLHVLCAHSFCCPRAKSCWKVFNKIVASACCIEPKGRRKRNELDRRKCNNCVTLPCSRSLWLPLLMWATVWNAFNDCKTVANNNYTAQAKSKS